MNLKKSLESLKNPWKSLEILEKFILYLKIP